MSLVCIDPGEAHKTWPHIETLLERATKRSGEVTLRELYEQILSGSALVWLAVSGGEIYGVAVTRLVIGPNGKYCELIACAGRRMSLWLPLLAKIEEFARAEGCESVRLSGRRGWARVLKEYREPWTTLEKRLA